MHFVQHTFAKTLCFAFGESRTHHHHSLPNPNDGRTGPVATSFAVTRFAIGGVGLTVLCTSSSAV